MTARAFADVTVGEQIGPVTVDVQRDKLVAYANASGDQNPIHQDEDFAKKVGLPNLIAHGMWTMGAAGSVAAAWVGDAGRIVSYGTRFTNMVVVPADGTELEVTGVVKSLDEDKKQATVEITATNGGQKVLGRCLMVAQLD